MKHSRNMALVLLCAALPMWSAHAVAAAQVLQMLQSQWALATYEVPAEQRTEALTKLAEEARQICSEECADAELLIWKGIIVSSLAGEKGGLGALGLAKESKASLERALSIDPEALDGSAFTSLGTLYHKVPGWPIGFGSDKKARKHLQKALQINPHGIDPNYFMAEFMLDEGEYAAAKEHLQKALAAPQRPGRIVADTGRRVEAQEMLARVEAKLR